MLTAAESRSEPQPALVALHIESGPSAHAPVPLKPGITIQVGRASRATVALPDDLFLSGVHFEVEFDGQECALRDLGSSNGTMLRNTRVVDAQLLPGDRFTAGRTVFALLKTKDESRQAAIPAPIAPLEQPARQRLLHELRTSWQPLYAVLDAAQDPRILGLLAQSKCDYHVLFDQQAAPELLPFAPYLASLPANSPVLESLVDLGWTRAWGVYFAALAPSAELLQRLRSLLVAELPDGRECLLRFHDPRVLQTLLTNATESQAEAFFSGIRSYLVPGEKPQSAVVFTRGADGVERTELLLTEKEAAVKERGKAQSGSASAARYGSAPAQRTKLTEVQAARLESQVRDPLAQSIFHAMQRTHPDPFAVQGDETMAELVQYGCKRADRYGIHTAPDATLYIVLMLEFGRDFDQDPALPWARDILNRRLPASRKLALLVKAGETTRTQ